MEKEKQIDEIRHILNGCRYNAPNNWCNTFNCSTCRAHQIYNANYRKQKWISVEERLPEPYVDVLVSDGVVTIDHISRDGKWYYHNHNALTHWMPIPEVPILEN